MTVILIALLLVLTLSPSFADVHRVIQSVQPLQAKMVDGTLVIGCTATSINEEKQYWLTAAHCLGKPRYIDTEQVEIIYLNAKSDLAVVKTRSKPTKALKMATRGPDYGDSIKIVGHPMGITTPIMFQGYVAAPVIDEGYMLLDMESCAGDSGSAVVNEKDEIVAVVQVNMRGNGTYCSGTTGASPWAVMARLVGRYFR